MGVLFDFLPLNREGLLGGRGLNIGFTVVVIKLSRSVLLITRSALSPHVSWPPKILLSF